MHTKIAKLIKVKTLTLRIDVPDDDSGAEAAHFGAQDSSDAIATPGDQGDLTPEVFFPSRSVLARNTRYDERLDDVVRRLQEENQKVNQAHEHGCRLWSQPVP